MRVVGSDLSLQATHHRQSLHAVEERLRVRSGDTMLSVDHTEIRADSSSLQVELSARAMPIAPGGLPPVAQGAPVPRGAASPIARGVPITGAPEVVEPGPAEAEVGETSLTPEQTVDALVIEQVFGVAAYRHAAAALLVRRAEEAGVTARVEPAQHAEAQPEQDWGLEYSYGERFEDHEVSTFTAEGRVQTADGRTLDLSLTRHLERHVVTQTAVQLTAGAPLDPLLLELGPGPLRLDASTEAFDLDADGELDQINRLASGAAFLALDRDGNGRIDDGSELFGPRTGSGWSELAALDADRNGWIDEADPAFADLGLWRPGADHAAPLSSRDIGAIYLGRALSPFEVRSPAGALQAEVHSSGLYLREDGTPGSVRRLDMVLG